MKGVSTLGQVVSAVLVLLLFFVALELMGDSFKLMGSGVAERMLATTANPFVGLFIGILATATVQSSSTVTSMVVALTAAGGLTVSGAIPIVMGANIGTSVTNTLVSLGHVTRRDEFRRAYAAATVHDIFNLLTVAILFPLELATRLLTRISSYLAEGLQGIGGADLLSPLKLVTQPISDGIAGVVNHNGIMLLIVGGALLFGALYLLVILLKRLVLGRTEHILHKYIFGAVPVALAVGVLVTVLVQSSSITTSLTVPLAAAGIVTVSRIFPFILGANLGTTVTSLLAALAVAGGGGESSILALHVAFAHLVFNGMGTIIFLPFPPIRQIPIRLAEGLGNLAAKNRFYGVAYIVLVFFVIPLAVIFATRGVDTTFYSDPAGAAGPDGAPMEIVDDPPADNVPQR